MNDRWDDFHDDLFGIPSKSTKRRIPVHDKENESVNNTVNNNNVQRRKSINLLELALKLVVPVSVATILLSLAAWAVVEIWDAIPR